MGATDHPRRDLDSFQWPCDFCDESTILSPGGDGVVMDVRSADGPGSHAIVAHRECLKDRHERARRRTRSCRLGRPDLSEDGERRRFGETGGVREQWIAVRQLNQPHDQLSGRGEGLAGVRPRGPLRPGRRGYRHRGRPEAQSATSTTVRERFPPACCWPGCRRIWWVRKRRLDPRTVRSRMRRRDLLVLLGESGGFEPRWSLGR